MREKACHRPQQYHASALRKNVKPLQIVESTHHPVPKLSSKPMPALFSNGFESVLFGHEPTGTYKNGTQTKTTNQWIPQKGKCMVHSWFMLPDAIPHQQDPMISGPRINAYAKRHLCSGSMRSTTSVSVISLRTSCKGWTDLDGKRQTRLRNGWRVCGSTKQKKGLDNSRNYNGFSLPSIMGCKRITFRI